MNARYYVRKTPGVIFGPFPLRSLIALYNKGFIAENMLFCKEGEQEWITFARLMNLPKPPSLSSAQRPAAVKSTVSTFFIVVMILNGLLACGFVIMGLVCFVSDVDLKREGFTSLGYGIMSAVIFHLLYLLYVLQTKK